MNEQNLPLGYIIGSLTALIEAINPDIPKLLQSKVSEDISKLLPHLVDTERRVCGAEVAEESAEAEFMRMLELYYAGIDAQGGALPNMRVVSNSGPFWVGYYQQKSSLDRIKIRKRLGEQIRVAREAKGLTLRELAELCGIKANHISRLEQGRYNYTIDTLTQIGTVLGISLNID